MGGFRDLRGFLDALRERGELVEIDAPVDPRLELAEIHRRVIAAGGPALLFRNPKGAAFPAVTNLFGTRERVELAFGEEPGEVVRRAAKLPETLMPPSLGALWGEKDLFRSLECLFLSTPARTSFELLLFPVQFREFVAQNLHPLGQQGVMN